MNVPPAQAAPVTSPQRPWWKKKRVAIPVVLLALVGIGAAMSGGETDSTSGDPVAAEARIGDTVKDGNLDITVKGVQCGKKSFTLSKAKGTYCVADVTVKNTGEKTEVDLNSWKLYQGDTEFEPDLGASIEASDVGSSGFLTELNPGLTMTSKVVYDVPPGTKPTAISVKDGMFGDGITVSL